MKTIKNNSDLFWFIYEEEERKFDYGFLKKMVVQLFVIYFAFFTFTNVAYFIFNGKWVSDTSFQTAKSFMFIGAVTYIIDLIEKSTNILHEQKQKKIKISQKDTKKELKPDGKNEIE